MKIGLSLLLCAAAAWAQNPDLVVYGGTAGGAITAISGARQGLKVTLLEPGTHIGGMVSGGLSRTDVGKREVIGGYALEFYWRAGTAYHMAQHLQDIAWLPEPHVAEAIFRKMLQDAGVTVVFHSRLREKDGVRKSGARIQSITMENGATYTARVFADCTYEGDLMAQAGVTFTWGREGSAQYGESLAGVRDETPLHQFRVDIPARGTDGRLLPEISPDPPGAPGSADRKVQAYNFRMILSHDPANQVAYPKPAAYDAGTVRAARALPGGDHGETGPRPALRRGGLGHRHPQPEGGHEQQRRLLHRLHRQIVGLSQRLLRAPRGDLEGPRGVHQGLLLVPGARSARAGRRCARKPTSGDSPGTNSPITATGPTSSTSARRAAWWANTSCRRRTFRRELTKPDPIGMGSYNSDSHNVERIVNPDGFVRNEGDMQVAVTPYQIPYRILVPKKAEMENLLVPVCFSATHVAYSTLRMEPQYMIIGQAAGVAAAMAIRRSLAVQDIDTAALTRTLVEHGAILEYEENRQAAIVARFKGRWPPASAK